MRVARVPKAGSEALGVRQADDTIAELEFVGRMDRQVKIRGMLLCCRVFWLLAPDLNKCLYTKRVVYGQLSFLHLAFDIPLFTTIIMEAEM